MTSRRSTQRKASHRRYVRGAIIALAAALPASSLAAPAAPGASREAGFEQHFQTFVTPPARFEPAPHAVDIASIDVPVEEPAPAVRSLGNGIASYYGRKFHGRPTASGERFDMNDLTAAHKTLPFGTLVRVTNPRNGKQVTVRINDRGPYAHGRTIDLSRAAAQEIGLIGRGHGSVELELLEG
ncbi:MAG: septal ring lytic transglycosylase RlpA family protein [Rhizobiales bacterium]|nr:septal ring lytic transglycosylase RlpA family protein [Hyphomicrobiales bacterium]